MTVIESLEQNALVQMARQLKGVEERLVEIGSSLEVIAGGHTGDKYQFTDQVNVE